MIYETMLNESKRLNIQIKNVQSQLKALPPGKLICSSNGKWHKWYWNNGQNTTYLSKKERSFAECLAFKNLLSLQLENMLREKEAIGLYLNHHNPNAQKDEQAFIASDKFKDLLSPHFTPLSEKLQAWVNEPYERNTRHPENLTFKTYSGINVRSKSEVLIDMFLYKNQIPFRYECPLELDGIILHPDFTIRHPQTGQVYYWEHFGLMDNPAYSKSACSKLQLYISNGIIPTIQLITTYETKEQPLSPETVENLVTQYFL